MERLSRTLAAAVVAVGLAGPCWAGQVKLEIRDGLVTLQARDASIREILAEWSRVGQTKIVNGERVPGGSLTLDLTEVPEAKVLDTLLRSVAGYLAAPRAVATAGGSRFDRIMIMTLPRPALSAQSSPASTPAFPPQPTFQQRGRMGYQPPPQPNLMADDPEDADGQPSPPTASPEGASQPGMLTPMPGERGVQPGMMTSPSPAASRPGMTTTPPTLPKPPGSPGGN